MIRIILGLLGLLPVATFAAVGTSEAEQTQSFIVTLLSFFSTQMLLNVGFALIAIVLTIVVSKFVQNRLFGYLERSNIGDEGSKEELIGVISRTVNVIVLIAGFSIAMGVLGIDLGIFMGGIGFGIGFTMRTFLTNFISGIIVVSQGTYHIGDLIGIDNRMGKIVKINALFTAVEEFDGVVFNIPNVRFFEENVRNYHTNDKRRIDVDVVVEYGTDIVQAKKVLEKVISNFPNVLRAPEPDILIDALGERGVQLRLRFWMHSKDNFFTLKSNITETINLAFRQTGIVIPYPQVTLSGGIDTFSNTHPSEKTPLQGYQSKNQKTV